MKGIHRMSARTCETLKIPGLYPDGGSLYLRVRPDGGKTWSFRYREHGTRILREMGLGAYPNTGLADARRRADQLRADHRAGVDLLGKRRDEQRRKRGVPTFGQMVVDYLAWRKLEGSSLVEWTTTLRLHAAKLNPIPVDQVQPEDVSAALKAVWATNKSAQRILNRVEQIFARAIALRFRTDNPATWSVQQHLLERKDVVSESFAAMPWQELPAFMERLRAEPGGAARALEFMILTAARAGEVIGGRYKRPISAAEVEGDLWTIPAERMKRGQEHRVPLSNRAEEVLGDVLALTGRHAGMLRSVLSRLGANATSVHGFRATFKSWAEENGYGSDPRLIEFALAHSLPDKVEASYNRVTRVEERRVVMQRWADFCAGQAVGATVVSLRRSG